MNTGLIKNTKTISCKIYPAGAKTSRVVTKNFTNLVMVWCQNESHKLALLSWLIHNCGMDNTIRYNTQLLKRFVASIKAVDVFYNIDSGLNTTLQYNRYAFKELIEEGYILSCGDQLVLNPLLSYQADYVTAKGYQLLCEGPQDTIGERYVQMVNEKVYGKTYSNKSRKKT